MTTRTVPGIFDVTARAMAHKIDREIMATWRPSPGDRVRFYDNGWHVGVVHQVDARQHRAEIERPQRKPRQHRRWVPLANIEPLPGGKPEIGEVGR